MRKRTPHPPPKPAAVRPGRRSAPPRHTPVPRRGDGRFPIVGIGASAGGLEALEEFLRHVPAGSGLAFVIVQHLDPTHKGLLPELLQRTTGMPVRQIKDRTRVQPDCVYVIPPNTDLSILRGVLHLLTPAAPRGLRLPIDLFFRALAADWHERSVGVLLSGMGTDGTLGVRAIKEQGGLVLVQDPAAAKFHSMPKSAIDAGLADVVAPARELPGRLLAYLRHAPRVPPAGLPLGDTTQSGLEKAMILLRAHTGHDFSQYKKTSVYRRIERRMGLHQLDTIAAYVRYLQANPQELDLLFKELLIGVTSFFRDPAAWKQLQTRGLPALLGGRPANQPLRAWVPGCATGEEAYSLAIAVTEALAERTPPGAGPLQLFATDLDRDAIARARQGIYPPNVVADVSPERLQRFFRKEEGGYRVAPAIRDLVTFAPQNVLADPPFTKLDLISCRNLLIYLDPELQKKLLPLFHYSLNPGGLLLLGSAESIGGFTDLFTSLDAKARLYQRSASTGRAEPIEVPAPPLRVRRAAAAAPRVPPLAASLQPLADQVLLQRYAPAAVLVTAQGDILYISGRTGKYLEPASGKVNWNVLAMAREGLRSELPDAIRQALRTPEGVTLRHRTVRTEGGVQVVDVTVQALTEPETLRGMVMLVFRDGAATPAPAPLDGAARVDVPRAPLAALEQKLHQAREDARATQEEMQTAQEELRSTNEELQSTNEELQSTNEELQSTNEELTTSKEEMQSLNEELQTVNAELQAKVDEWSRASADMKNLLNSTDIATLFLDGALRVRRFTTQATTLIKLIPGDVGRPVTDLASALLYPDLPADAQEVLQTLAPIEKELATQDGRWFKGRLMPYRTLEDKIDGVVITFTEITRAKKLEAKLRQALAAPHA
jgi:two-component system, chemotaxis family, CheB/CheR fusion protein